ncbi:MAG: hypothetical protein ABI995_01435 [Acidobacteriota bacterium]
MNLQFIAAMAAYVVLALLAWRTLDHELLWATWVFLGGFALKTFLVVLKRRQD